LTTPQQDASEKLEGLEKEKKRLEVEIARLRVRMSQMIGNPSFAERIYGEVLVAIYSKDSVVNQISQNSRSLEEMENRVNTIERNLKNCDSLITSISQLAINKMQGIQNELSAIKAILSGQEHFLDFSDPSIALFNIQTIRDILKDL
jgi:chaperonin cofactor prefoldin